MYYGYVSTSVQRKRVFIVTKGFASEEVAERALLAATQKAKPIRKAIYQGDLREYGVLKSSMPLQVGAVV